jgi:hypothetical protein
MPGPVTDAHRYKYRDNVELAIKERKPIFEHAFTFAPDLAGEAAQVLDIIGEGEARRDAPEGGDTPNIGATHEPVWITPTRIDWGKIIEKGDPIRALVEYKSAYVQGGARSITRTKNTIGAEAIFANRKIGKHGTTSAAYNATGRTVAKTVGSSDGSTDVGMNVKKILKAYNYLEEAEVDIDEEEIFLALDPTENEELYHDVTYVSKDYRNKAVIEEKRVREILGLKIIGTKKLSIYDSAEAANTSVAALWCKRGMYYGPFSELMVRSTENPAKQYREHPYMEQWYGATRAYDELVVKILNKR